jgi:putative protease
MSKRYSHVLPYDLSRYRKQPGDQLLPILDLTSVKDKELSYFPEGIYVQVSSISDVFAVQGISPVRIIIDYNSETKADLINQKTVLPFSKKQIYISLDPFCTSSQEDELSEELDKLIQNGYFNFVANNIAHLGMLKNKKVNVIAGPYLYTFNRWAVSWLENQDVGAFIMPYENSRRNLEATFDQKIRPRVLVPVFAYPTLFRMRFKLPQDYDFTYFKDKEEKVFRVNSSEDGSFVIPDEPFCITDKIKVLESAGFKRILIDFSNTKVFRNQIKAIMTSLTKAQPLPYISRFNWKDGFYSPQQMEAYKAATQRALEKSSKQRDSHSKKQNARNLKKKKR